ncbi:MAG: hypothetical protein ACLFTP_11175 [Rhodosalinus sp.]
MDIVANMFAGPLGLAAGFALVAAAALRLRRLRAEDPDRDRG